MVDYRKQILGNMRILYPQGTRIKLIKMNDPYAPKPGTCGTVLDIDDAGSILIRWDDGSQLSLLVDADKFEKIEES
ncbi:hypothetical protein HMPREF1356_02256 [Enterococcus faecium C1904]|uniref:DUF4314 domain-containing protein n=1 Tax=Enterococcus faecium TaxID=1352 RepID=UPI000282982D|nr:DUF4314 domain-containing protein [Enterococcus faecium]EJY19106.1 hypothetical protein HMPREF1356_02256 [Enterococcus faecium C1904]MBA1325995.1 DUF4314 domain-containing protein [Enterococcus faecium]